jgi:hypothetical protein
MKALLVFVLMMSAAFGQDPTAYLKSFDNKIYSLKSKGIKDFVVDIESSKLTKEMNDQQLFGKIKELIFRVYWTATPERLAIEIIGLPEGFKEVKEELKMNILGTIDNLLPQSTTQRFAGYKFSQGPKQREITAKDASGIAPIPSFTIKFDGQDKIFEVVGNKPVGTFTVKPVYVKESFADGKWVLTEQTTTSSEGGQVLTIKKALRYGKSNGIDVLSEVTVSTQQKLVSDPSKTSSSSETMTFKNYKINEGDGLKHFLGESKASPSGP